MAPVHRGLMVLDVDGVVLKGHLMVALGRSLGRWMHLRTLADCVRFDRGRIEIDALLHKVYGRLRDEPVDRLWQVYRGLALQAGAAETVQALRDAGWRVILLSSGVPDFLVGHLVARLGADAGAGIHVETKDGRLTGRVGGELTSAEGKIAHVERIIRREQWTWADVVVVGDDRNNLPLMLRAGTSIGFNPMLQVRRSARVIVDATDLRAVLPAVERALRPRTPRVAAERRHPVALGAWRRELRRKLLHGTAAFMPALVARWPAGVLTVLLVAALLYALWEELRLNGLRVPILWRVSRSVLREGERRRLALAPLTMALGVAFCAAAYRPAVACASIFVLAFADSAASIVGERWGRLRLPYSRTKTLEGLLAGLVIGAASASVFVSAPAAAAGGVAGALVESLDLRAWDNFWVPVCAGLAIEAVRTFGG